MLLLTKDKRAKVGNLPKRNAVSEIGEHFMQKYFHLVFKKVFPRQYHSIGALHSSHVLLLPRQKGEAWEHFKKKYPFENRKQWIDKKNHFNFVQTIHCVVLEICPFNAKRCNSQQIIPMQRSWRNPTFKLWICSENISGENDLHLHRLSIHQQPCPNSLTIPNSNVT